MSSFIQRTKQLVIENTLLREERSTQVFSLLDAWSMLISMVKTNSMVRMSDDVTGCLLHAERQGDHYLIQMLAFTSRGEPIYRSGDTVLGSVLTAYNLASDVRDALDRDGDLTLRVEQLKIPKAANRGEGEDD